MSATLEIQRKDYNEETEETFYGIYAVEVTAEANAEDAEPAYAEYEVYGVGEIVKSGKVRRSDFQKYNFVSRPKYAEVGDMVRFKDDDQTDDVYIIGVVNKVFRKNKQGISYIDITPISYKIDEEEDECQNDDDWDTAVNTTSYDFPPRDKDIPIRYLDNDSMWYNRSYYYTHSFIADDYIPFNRSSSKKYNISKISNMYKLKQK